MKYSETAYISNDIEINIKKRVINNITVYIPLYVKASDATKIYDEITGYGELRPYEMLDALKEYYPYIKNIDRGEIDNDYIFVEDIGVFYEDTHVRIVVEYSKYSKAVCHIDDKRVDLINIFSNSKGDNIAKDKDNIKKMKEAVYSAFGVPTFEAFDKITDELKDTYIKKNHDYGNSFDKSIDKFGLTAAVVRMNDKMERLSSLINKDAKVNESIRDTVMDLANYCIMTAMYLDNKKENK